MNWMTEGDNWDPFERNLRWGVQRKVLWACSLWHFMRKAYRCYARTDYFQHLNPLTKMWKVQTIFDLNIRKVNFSWWDDALWRVINGFEQVCWRCCCDIVLPWTFADEEPMAQIATNKQFYLNQFFTHTCCWKTKPTTTLNIKKLYVLF